MIRVATIVIFIKREDRLITVKLEIPGQSKVIPGSLDRLLKLVKSQDCPGQPWTVGNYVVIIDRKLRVKDLPLSCVPVGQFY